MALHTAKTYLYFGTSEGSLTDNIAIKDVPDLGGEPATVETTTLSDWPTKTYTLGLQDISNATFTLNYTKEDYKKLNDLAKAGNTLYFQIRIGENGANGVFAFKGKISVWKSAIEVDGVQEFKLCVTPENGFEFKETP